jgi:hypothetical protein
MHLHHGSNRGRRAPLPSSRGASLRRNIPYIEQAHSHQLEVDLAASYLCCLRNGNILTCVVLELMLGQGGEAVALTQTGISAGRIQESGKVYLHFTSHHSHQFKI